MHRVTRPIGWVKAAKKDFEKFPKAVRERMSTALTIVAEGGKAHIAKSMKGLGAGVIEIALRYRIDAYQIGPRERQCFPRLRRSRCGHKFGRSLWDR